MLNGELKSTQRRSGSLKNTKPLLQRIREAMTNLRLSHQRMCIHAPRKMSVAGLTSAIGCIGIGGALAVSAPISPMAAALTCAFAGAAGYAAQGYTQTKVNNHGIRLTAQKQFTLALWAGLGTALGAGVGYMAHDIHNESYEPHYSNQQTKLNTDNPADNQNALDYTGIKQTGSRQWEVYDSAIENKLVLTVN